MIKKVNHFTMNFHAIISCVRSPLKSIEDVKLKENHTCLSYNLKYLKVVANVLFISA